MIMDIPEHHITQCLMIDTEDTLTDEQQLGSWMSDWVERCADVGDVGMGRRHGRLKVD